MKKIILLLAVLLSLKSSAQIRSAAKLDSIRKPAIDSMRIAISGKLLVIDSVTMQSARTRVSAVQWKEISDLAKDANLKIDRYIKCPMLSPNKNKYLRELISAQMLLKSKIKLINSGN